MNLTWLEYLENYEGQNVDGIKKILETESTNLNTVVETVLNAHPYMTVREAKVIVESEFTNAKKAPEGVDYVWVASNLDKIVDKLDSLTEGEIKIIIHNDTSKGSSSAAFPMPIVFNDDPNGMDVEVETTKRGRGRPKKNLGAPLEPTGVVPNLSGDPKGMTGLGVGDGEKLGLSEELSEEDMVERLSKLGYSVKKNDDEPGTENMESGEEAEAELQGEETPEIEPEGEDDLPGDGDNGLKIKWADIVSILDKDENGVEDNEQKEVADGTSEEEYEKDDGGLEAVTDEKDEDELDEEIKTLRLRKPVDHITVGAAGKINVDRNQATFSGGTVEVPEDIDKDEVEECNTPKPKEVKKVGKKA